MSRKSLKSQLTQGAEDGDLSAQKALNDLNEEEGGYRCRPLEKGDWVYIKTAIYAYVGMIQDLDHEEYVLGPETTEVYETGAFPTFCDGSAKYCELYPDETRIRRGAIVSIHRYRAGRHPTSRTQPQD